ncbi:MAG TPA: single-stranded DNA-binding protein [Patescibacteria group bacterium]|nr:single-stranded DNA-binding protein [Patescibacteria group bacterium]
MARSLNKVLLIGNLTRDPELRYTPQGTAVVTFSIATNRQWKTESGEMKDQAEFHRVVAWDKLAEICGKMLKKGTRCYVEGRLQTRSWQAQDGAQKQTTEIVISDMIVLDNKSSNTTSDVNIPDDFNQEPQEKAEPKKEVKKEEPKVEEEPEVNEDDIPF